MHYLREAVSRGSTLYLSAVVVSEFHAKQPIMALPLCNFRALPLNMDHAMMAGEGVLEIVILGVAVFPHVVRCGRERPHRAGSRTEAAFIGAEPCREGNSAPAFQRFRADKGHRRGQGVDHGRLRYAGHEGLHSQRNESYRMQRRRLANTL